MHYTPTLHCLIAKWKSSSGCAGTCIHACSSEFPPTSAAYILQPLQYIGCLDLTELFGSFFIVEAKWQWSFRREQALQTKKKNRSTLSSCNPFMVFPIHLMLVRPGEGFLHTVLPMLCGPDLHFSAIFYNARAARKVWQVFQYVPAGTQ